MRASPLLDDDAEALAEALVGEDVAAMLTWGISETTNAFALDWMAGGSTDLSGVQLSVLTSIISAPFGDEGTPSLVDQ
jgi:hypothetical protein